MKNNASVAYSFLLVVCDVLALVAAFAGAFLIRVTFSEKAITQPVPALTYIGLFAALLPFWILVFGLLGLYNSNIYEKRFSEIGRLFMGSFVGMLFVIAVDFISVNPIFPAKSIPIYGFLLSFVFLVLLRNLARATRIILFGFNIGISNVLIIGNTSIAEELTESLRHSRTSGYRVIGVVANKHTDTDHFEGIKVFDTFGEAVHKLQSQNIHSIVQTELYNDAALDNEILGFAQENHVSYRFIPGNAELFVGNIQVELFRNSVPVVAVHQTPLIGWGRVVKRLFDVVVALTVLILVSPLMLLIALLEVLAGGGFPIFFRQTRLTRFNNEFRVFKFRTHRNGISGLTDKQAFAKIKKPELYDAYVANGYALANDPRLTWFGRFLRRTSLDELPQLFNVIKGDLSLVGPRALIPEELNTYNKKHTILSVKSGLTGLAQVSGRQNISFEERRKLDMYYVQNWTFWMDLVILIKTIRVIFTGEGAQ